MNDLYTLNEQGEPVKVAHHATWARWMEECPSRRAVARDTISARHWEAEVVDVSRSRLWAWRCPPLLFATTICGGPLDQYQERYCTRAEAQAATRQPWPG